MSDEHSIDDEPEDNTPKFPIRRQASPQQAILAIGFVFFLGVVIGFLLCRTF